MNRARRAPLKRRRGAPAIALLACSAAAASAITYAGRKSIAADAGGACPEPMRVWAHGSAESGVGRVARPGSLEHATMCVLLLLRCDSESVLLPLLPLLRVV